MKITQKIYNFLGRLKNRHLSQKSLCPLHIEVGDNSAPIPYFRDVLELFGITVEGLNDLVPSDTSLTVKIIINATNGLKKDRKIVLFLENSCIA